ncbi:hypothetical protein Tco_0760273 [Tanacetum coccineum]
MSRIQSFINNDDGAILQGVDEAIGHSSPSLSFSCHSFCSPQLSSGLIRCTFLPRPQDSGTFCCIHFNFSMAVMAFVENHHISLLTSSADV